LKNQTQVIIWNFYFQMPRPNYYQLKKNMPHISLNTYDKLFIIRYNLHKDEA
jgi:hypothetical protein